MEKNVTFTIFLHVFCRLDIPLGYDRGLTRAETLTNMAVLGEGVSKETSPHSYFAFYFLPRHQLLTTEGQTAAGGGLFV